MASSELFARLRELKKQRQLEAALALVQRALDEEPGDLFLKASLADVLVRMRRQTQARQVIDEILHIAPDHLGALIALGDLERSRGRHAHALEAYALAEQAGRDGKLGGYIAGRKAQELSRLARHEEALGTLDDALARHPGDPWLLRQRIEAMLASGRTAQAREELERLAAAHPSDAALRKLLLESRVRDRPQEEVDRQLEGALATRAGRDDPQIWSLRARRAWDAGHWAEAAQSFLALHRLDPAQSFALKKAGFAYRKAGDDARAVECLEQAFLDDPADIYVRQCLTGCLRRQGDLARLLALFDRALARHPEARVLIGLRKKLAKDAGTPAGAAHDASQGDEA